MDDGDDYEDDRPRQWSQSDHNISHDPLSQVSYIYCSYLKCSYNVQWIKTENLTKSLLPVIYESRTASVFLKPSILSVSQILVLLHSIIPGTFKNLVSF